MTSFLVPAVLGALSRWANPTAATAPPPVFQAGRVYTYQAMVVSPRGDTLSRERMTVTPTGRPRKYQKKLQTGLAIRYAYSEQESLTFLAHPSPLAQKPGAPKLYAWAKSLETGAIENPQQVWMHPLRDNQYV